MSNKLKVLALLPILSLFLTACTLSDLPLIGQFLPGGEVEEGPVNLTMWGLWEPESVYAPLIEKYKQQIEQPEASIVYENRNVQDTLVEYKERIFSRASGQGPGADVMVVHNSWVKRMVSSGLLAPMPSDLMDSATFEAVYYPVAAEDLLIDGNIYAIPAYYEGLALVYNREHFDEIGQSSPPTAWEEFRRLALQLNSTSEDGERRYGAAMGSATNIDHFADILGLMWAQAGVSIPDDLDSTAAQDALTFYTNFVIEDAVWNSSNVEATTAFINGEVSMIIVPSWQILRILESVEDPTNVGAAPVPQAIPSRPATWASYWVYVVPANRPSPNAAWGFVNFLGQEEQVRDIFNEASKVRFFGTPYARVDMASELNSNDYLRPLLDTAEYAKSAEIANLSGNRRQVDALAEAVDAVLRGGDEEEALREAKQQIQ